MKHFKRNTAVGAACALGLGLLVAPQAAVATGSPDADPGNSTQAVTEQVVNLLHFNDFHGRITGAETDDEGVYTPSSTVMFAATIEELRAAAPADSTLLLSGGDSIGASNFTSASQQDEPTLDVLNALELDASAVGNHEFDQGVDDLTDRVGIDGTSGLAQFPYLAANVTVDGTPLGDGYETFAVGDITVAVIGAVTEQTPSLVDGSGIVGVEFGDPVEAVNAIAADLTDGDATNDEADVIVAEIHEGSQVVVPLNAPQADQQALLGPDAAGGGVFGNIVNNLSADVDVIFNGHTHRTYTWMAPVPGVDGATRPVVQSNEYSNLVGQVTLTVATDSETGESTVAVDALTNHERLTATTEAEVDALIAEHPRVSAVADIAEAAVAQADIVGNEPVGTISGPITVPAESNGNRGEESTAAQMVANMYRDQLASETRGAAEIGIVNPGGVRDSFLYEASGEETADGIVTLAEANTMLPFINNLWTITMTGAELDLLLEQQWQRSADGVPFTSGRTYLQLGLSDNVTYVSDPSRAIDDRVSDIQIDGEYVTSDQEVRIASASFLIGVGGSQPGDNFWAFSEGADARDSGLVDQDALLAYLGDNANLAPDYSVRHVDITGLPVAAEKGGEVTIQVSQIDRIRSTGAVPSTTLEVLNSAGEVVGSGDVVVTNDGQGVPLRSSAEVTFTADAAEAGVATFTLRADNGTEIPFELEVLPTDRIAGENRFQTAVEISKDVYPEGAPVVYIASGEVWPDALTAGPAAAHEGGPLLLVRKGEAPAVVLDEIARLGADRVVIVGGLPSVTAEVETAIDAIATVTTTDRVAGQNRFETSRLVAEYAFETAGGAYVATGLRFPDALSAGAAAGHLEWPLVLVDTRAEIPAATITTLDDLGVQDVRIAGSVDAVPGSNAGELVDAGYSVLREGGANRFITSAMVTLGAFDAAPSGAYLATGQLFPDALAGGAAAGAQGSPLLITREGCVPQPVLDALDQLAPTSITLLGGEPSLSLNAARLISCV